MVSNYYRRVSSSTTNFLPFTAVRIRSSLKPKLNVRISSIGDCCKMPSLLLLNCGTCLIIKRWKYNPHKRRCSSGWNVCVCVRARSAPKRTGKLHFELRAHPNDQIHTKYVEMAGLESIHLNTVYVLSGREQLGENPMCVIVLKWQTGASILIKQQNAKRKSLTALNLNNIYSFNKH